MEIAGKVLAITDTVLKSKIAKALTVLKRTFALYPLSSTALSFNGGKDSTVVLHLLRVALAQYLEQQGDAPEGNVNVCSFFFDKDNDFPEVKQFVRAVDQRYQLGTTWIRDEDFKHGLVSYLGRTGVTAIVLGTRRGDPNAGEQEFFCPSSEGWPAFMRVNPILDWTYQDVWAFLRTISVDYCTLYDQGYTSLGSMQTTLPNSALKTEDGSFLAAYQLQDGRLERAGRRNYAHQIEERKQAAIQLPTTLSPSAGIVVVGDEILSGKITDTNTTFLCQELHKIGWQVCKVVVVPDDKAVIATEVSQLSEAMQVVITSGGVGPTLDDVTLAGVAQAMGKPLVRHPELEQRINVRFGSVVTRAHLKMAELPDDEDVELIEYDMDDGTRSAFPLVRCRNVFVLPGVPHLLRQKWRAVRGWLTAVRQLAPFRNVVLRVRAPDEAQLAPLLDALEETVQQDVAIGSYPVSGQPDGAAVLLTLESKDTANLEAALAELRGLLPHELLISEERDVAELMTRKRSSLQLERPPPPQA